MEFNGIVNRLLQKTSQGRKRKLRLRTYAVICLNEECGVLEWVPHTTGYRQAFTLDALLHLLAYKLFCAAMYTHFLVSSTSRWTADSQMRAAEHIAAAQSCQQTLADRSAERYSACTCVLQALYARLITSLYYCECTTV
eukprot:12630-Heterococcus_DN1.PRE.1